MAHPTLTARRFALVVVGLAIVLAAALAIGFAIGASRAGVGDLFTRGEGSAVARKLLLEIRLPRVLAAAVLGGALAVAGTIFQALLRNPLADPYVLGVSGGASLGGVVALVAGAGGSAWTIPLASFVGALGALFVISRAASRGGRLSIETLLLTGVVFNAFAGAAIFFLESVASLEELHSMVFFLLGRVPTLGLFEIGLLAAVTLVATLVLGARGRAWNALALGEEEAARLGVEVDRLRREGFVLASLLTALAVSISGMIGFVGLVVPHLLRLLLGPDHRLLIPATLLGGGAFLVFADVVARTAIAPRELPVGVVTALVGGPFFLAVLRRRGASVG